MRTLIAGFIAGVVLGVGGTAVFTQEPAPTPARPVPASVTLAVGYHSQYTAPLVLSGGPVRLCAWRVTPRLDEPFAAGRGTATISFFTGPDKTGVVAADLLVGAVASGRTSFRGDGCTTLQIGTAGVQSVDLNSSNSAWVFTVIYE